MDLDDVRDGIAARLSTITGLNVADHVPEKIIPPHAIVALANFSYDDTFGDLYTANFTVTVYVAAPTFKLGQDALDPYISPTGTKSVREAVNGTAGGNTHSTRVLGGTGPLLEVMEDGQSFMKAEWNVEVYA